MQTSRILTETLKNDLASGMLAPLLEAIRSDRDLNMEFRGKCVDIYYKGYRLHLESAGGRGYRISVNEAFLETISLPLASPADVAKFVTTELPGIKQKMATHHSCGNEIEFEQLLIRANNTERGKRPGDTAADLI